MTTETRRSSCRSSPGTASTPCTRRAAACWTRGSWTLDPITAHGITDALRDAELLARAVAGGSERALDDYQATRDALSLDLFRITDSIAAYDWDLPAIQEMHLVLSREMNREVEAMVELHGQSQPPLRRTA